jgi:hypothetical protein
MAEPQSQPDIQQTPAQGAMAAYVMKLFKATSRTRYAEESEWAVAGYFDQMKQWLEEDTQSGNKLRPMTKKKGGKWPQPVTNLFSKTIATNANSLGADIPEMQAQSDNYDARNRRAAEAAENVIDAANRESGMEILNPTLARRVVLWGLGCTFDTIAFDHSTVEVPDMAPEQAAQPGTAAPAVGDGSAQAEGAQGASGVQGATAPQAAAGAGGPGQPGAAQLAPPQPQALSGGGAEQAGEQGADQISDSEAPQITGVQTVPTARLKTYLLTPFEFLLPRDAQDANLAPWQIVRWRRPLGEVKENYPDYADKFTADDAATELAFYYLNTLRSLSYQNSKTNEASEEYCTLTILWTDWTSVPEEVQKKIAAEWQNLPSEIYEEQGFTKLQAATEYGLFAVVWNDVIVQWAENPWDGDSPLTFFPWQKDCVSVYPKGLSVELIPLTKSLNRVDSLMMRAVMSHGTQKLLWPTTQTTPIPSGDPVEIVQWDPQGDGKVRPEYVSGTPYGPVLIQLRNQIVNDFKELGFTNSVAEGEMPGAGTAFRLAAYMGAKAEESRKTQRFLFEQASEIRSRKLVKMARKVWTEPRKVQVSGFNNRWGAIQLEAADIPNGGYEMNVIQDSSRPKTLTEKLQALEMAQQGGYINPQDSQVREYVLDNLGLQELDPADHLQYMKADRDLEKLKQGIQPMESPFEKWDIPLRVIAEYTLTEEFEDMPENIRHGILMYGQYLSEKLQVAQGAQIGAMPPPPGPGPGAPPPGGPHGGPPIHGLPPSQLARRGGVGGQPASHVLGQVPGAQVSNDQVQGAAIREAADIVPNSPSPTA